MKRREFIKFAAGVTAAWPLTARAQPRAMPVVGILSPEGPKTGNIEGLFAGLRELGYVEGRNITFEYRWANGSHEKLTEFAEDLVRLRVDVIVAFVTPASLAAKRATATIPIVMVGTADPVGIGVIASLAGLMSFAPNYADQYKRSAVYVDKILKGVRPADLPVEQATKIELVVNLTTAKKLGIDIPTSILLRADNLIG